MLEERRRLLPQDPSKSQLATRDRIAAGVTDTHIARSGSVGSVLTLRLEENFFRLIVLLSNTEQCLSPFPRTPTAVTHPEVFVTHPAVL